MILHNICAYIPRIRFNHIHSVEFQYKALNNIHVLCCNTHFYTIYQNYSTLDPAEYKQVGTRSNYEAALCRELCNCITLGTQGELLYSLISQKESAQRVFVSPIVKKV